MQQQKDLFEHYKQLPIKEDPYVTGLKLANSLKDSELIPFIHINGRQVNFYYCDPTVYRNSHQVMQEHIWVLMQQEEHQEIILIMIFQVL